MGQPERMPIFERYEQSSGAGINRLLKKSILTEEIVIPAKAGIQNILKTLDSRFHGNDDQMREYSFSIAC